MSRLPLRAILGMLTMISLVIALHVYLGARLITGLGLTGVAGSAAWTVVALLFVSVPLGALTTRAGPRWVGVPLWWVSHLWIGVFGLLLVSVLAGDVARLLWTAIATPSAQAAQRAVRVEATLIVGLLLPAIAYGYRTARGPARIEQVTVPIPGLGAGMAGLKVVQISDLHIGQTLDGKFLERVVEQVNALDADVVAITGDLVDGTVARLRDEVAPLAKLRAKLGVFYVNGNHEYYSGPVAWERHVASLGITVLHNEHRVVERGGDSLVIAGITDHNGGHFGPEHQPRPDAAVAGAPEGVPRILLAHQPRSATEAAPFGYALQLSGHTHGGQIFPFMFFVRLQQPVVSGLHKLAGMWVYTNRGTGYWGPPLRIGPSPEITALTLVPAAKA
ncbi:MAG TPA: metallophosphoesterase [Myxococcaceae bacterium]|nr:metallophosphoesterase [Myxococcaceae bacterium]